MQQRMDIKVAITFFYPNRTERGSLWHDQFLMEEVILNNTLDYSYIILLILHKITLFEVYGRICVLYTN